MRLLTIFLVYCFICSKGFAQGVSNSLEKKVRLLTWSAQSCEDTYDPYKLQSRITSKETDKGITTITVNFSDNCCAEFDPQLEFHNGKLFLLPYKKYKGDYCSCDCCFSVSYRIDGLKTNDYTVFFRNEEIIVSNDHYKTVKPSSEIYNGMEINRLNKYGFQEGKWVEFFNEGTIRSEIQFPEKSLYYEPEFIWSKGYYPSGNLAHYYRQDTSEFWFEDGELKFQRLRYYSGDTTFEKSFRKYENRQLDQKYLERYYPTIFKSKFDTAYRGEGGKWDYLYNEAYYSDGQPKYLQGRDTSYTWFENGNIKLKEFNYGKIEYNNINQMVEQSYHWIEPNPYGGRDLPNSIYIHYHKNGVINEIHHVRDEMLDNGASRAPGVHYHWKWDENLNQTDFPKKWDDELPWSKFPGIKKSLTGAKNP